jgi:RHS repeat-associated protein
MTATTLSTDTLQRDADDIGKTYTLGHDVIAQQAPQLASGDPLYLLYDGHGSTRALLDPDADVVEVYAYDAYGNAIGFDPGAALTTFLYSGEQTDQTGLQYLRDRYLDPSAGRFLTFDAFAGNTSDPLSLHKYLYAHANPVMGVDPSGMFIFLAELGKIAHQQITVLHREAHRGQSVTYGASIPGAAGRILPDSMNFTTGKISEIKPADGGSIASGYLQLRAAIT